jgi:hypothetical protein
VDLEVVVVSVSVLASVSAKVLDLELVAVWEEELAQGCQGNHCYWRIPCWGQCCRDHRCHLTGRFHNCWHRPNYSNNIVE